MDVKARVKDNLGLTDDEITNLIKSMNRFTGKIDALYKWNIPPLKEFGFEPKGVSPYEKTIELRKWFKARLIAGNDNYEDLCKWIVKDWGGIKTGKDENLMASILNAFDIHNGNGVNFNFERIASWSKALAFQFPETRAIYDVRVIYSLNWLLLKVGSKKFLPMSEGRNSLLNFFPYENLLYFQSIGFERVLNEFEVDLKSREENDKKSHLVNTLGKEVFIENKSAYQAYCEILLLLSTGTYGPNDLLGVTKIEMILFSIADTEIVKEVFTNLRNLNLK